LTVSSGPPIFSPKKEGTRGVEIEMFLKGYVHDPITYMPIIVLREVSGERVLPIWVGKAEGDAIALQIEGIQTPRPMTHDLLKTVIEELGGRVERVVVCDLRDNTFYATLHVLSPSGPRTVDARPSDAIALAQRSGARIFVEEAVIQKARSGEPSREAMGVGRLDRLEKWLANLSDDDLGKYKM
jgi:bifunctional DNase/RNase